MCPLSEIIAVDLDTSRLAMARELGATQTINPRKIKDVVGKIRDLTHGAGVDYAVECSGSTIGKFTCAPPSSYLVNRFHPSCRSILCLVRFLLDIAE
jgi:threonine dehydrogenase-like Zn-dependent dehydrogenase